MSDDVNAVSALRSSRTLTALPQFKQYLLPFIEYTNAVKVRPLTPYISWGECGPNRLRILGNLGGGSFSLQLAFNSKNVSPEWLLGIENAPIETLHFGPELGGPDLTVAFNVLSGEFVAQKARVLPNDRRVEFGLFFPSEAMLGFGCVFDEALANQIAYKPPIFIGESVGRGFQPELEILVDHAILSAQQVTVIEAGDALLLGQMQDIKAFLRIKGNSPLFWGAISGNQLKIQQEVLNMQEVNRHEAELFSNQIMVEAVIRPSAMSVEELCMLGPGSVVELRESIQSTRVFLRANGQTIAEGKLIALGDRLAVQIQKTLSVKSV
jgi:flagellar motor switch/type III secretory pathway protein FliN